jgi:hypothetical protein
MMLRYWQLRQNYVTRTSNRVRRKYFMVIENSESLSASEPPRRQGLSARALAIAALFLLLIGILGGGWAMNRFFPDGKLAELGNNVLNPLAATPEVQAPTPPAQAVDAPSAALAAADAEVLASRIADLEQRLARISLEAQSASGNATRAEGLLVAFAVRRALDRGLPLGYLEPQLRLRFGDAQPNAVKTILDAARDPVTIEQLRGQLETLAPQLIGGIGYDSESFWTAIQREFSELLILRPADSLSTTAQERLERVRRYLTAAQVDKAIGEVEAMPGAKVAADWLIDARRYHEARRALDLIETAAILEPRETAPVINPEPTPAR